MIEKIPTPEFSKEELELIEALRKGGPEGQNKLITWMEAQKKIAQSEPRPNMEMNLRLARIYKAAGLKDAAWDILEAVRFQPHNENADDLYKAAMSLMDEIDQESGA